MAQMKDSDDLKNSETEKPEQEPSEEYKNFERAMRGILSIPPNEAKKIVERTPFEGEPSPEE
jgi:hypothetical protein